MNKILFIDLDDTLIETKSDKTFPKDITDWKFKKNALYSLSTYASDHYIRIITNQTGINEGYYKPKDIQCKIDSVITNIEEYCINEIQVMPNIDYVISGMSVHSKVRKPNPKIALDIMKSLKVESVNCLMIGNASGLYRKTLVDTIPYKTPHGEILFKDISSHSYKELDSLSGDKYYIDDPNNVLIHKRVFSKEAEQLIKSSHLKMLKVYSLKKDFSDSDAMFAENAGIKYIDVNEFLSNELEFDLTPEKSIGNLPRKQVIGGKL